MVRQFRSSAWCLLLASILPLSNALAAGWPEDYAVHDGTQSPDGHYGIIVPTDDLGEFDAHGKAIHGNTNYLVDIKAHKVLGKIKCDEYFERENHKTLTADWSADCKWCVAIYEGRFGFEGIALLERKSSGLTEIDIGKRIYKALESAAGEGYGSAHFRFSGNERLLVRALLYTGEPKGNDEKTRFARFEGTFDLKSGKWTKVDARREKWKRPGKDESYSDEYLTAETAYSDYMPGGFDGASDKEKTDRLDDLMNEVYRGVRALLPAEQFQKVKKEQIEWLKERDAAVSLAEKCKLMEARIKALQDLLW